MRRDEHVAARQQHGARVAIVIARREIGAGRPRHRRRVEDRRVRDMGRLIVRCARAEHGRVGPQDALARFARRSVRAARKDDRRLVVVPRERSLRRAEARPRPRVLGVGVGVPLGVWSREYVDRDERSVGQKRPAFLGVEVLALAGEAERGPRHRRGIELGDALVELVAQKKLAIRHHDRRCVADEVPASRRIDLCPCVGDRIVNCALVRQRERAAEVVFAAFDQHAAVSEHGRRGRIWPVVPRGGQARNLRPRAVEIAAARVRRQLPETGVRVVLEEDAAIGQQERRVKADVGRRLIRQRFERRAGCNAGKRKSCGEQDRSKAAFHGIPFGCVRTPRSYSTLPCAGFAWLSLRVRARRATNRSANGSTNRELRFFACPSRRTSFAKSTVGIFTHGSNQSGALDCDASWPNGGLMRALPAVVLLMSMVVRATAGDLTVQIDDGHGHPAGDAVVTLRSDNAQRADVRAPETKIVDQRDETFIPYVEIFRPGDSVVFRNSDTTRHHVYSFAAAQELRVRHRARR